MLLIRHLAQQIMDQILPLIKENINIMDLQGIIIASGQKNRLGEPHKGAEEVLRSKKTVEIYPEDVESYPGARPGVNLPLFLEEDLIGVAGISGHPDEVRKSVQLLKTITELILSREHLRQNLLSESRLKEHFAKLLLTPSPDDEKKLRELAAILHFDLQSGYDVFVIRLDFLQTNTAPLHELEAAQCQEYLPAHLQNAGLLDEEDFILIRPQEALLLQHKTGNGKELFSVLSQIFPGEKVSLGQGSYASCWQQLAPAYQEAAFASKQGAYTFIGQSDILSAYLSTKASEQSVPALAALREQILSTVGAKYDMAATIRCLLAQNLHLTRTAEALFIHRNTLLFRLEKLKKATGLDPCHLLSHAFLCHFIF